MDVGSETCCSPRDERPTLLTPLFFDEAAFDLEKSKLQSIELDTPDVQGGCPFEYLHAWDQIHKPETNPRLWSPIVSSERDSVPFSDQFGLSPDNIECPSFKHPTSALQRTSPEPRRVLQTASPISRSIDEEINDCIDLYDQVAALSHGLKR